MSLYISIEGNRQWNIFVWSVLNELLFSTPFWRYFTLTGIRTFRMWINNKNGFIIFIASSIYLSHSRIISDETKQLTGLLYCSDKNHKNQHKNSVAFILYCSLKLTKTRNGNGRLNDLHRQSQPVMPPTNLLKTLFCLAYKYICARNPFALHTYTHRIYTNKKIIFYLHSLNTTSPVQSMDKSNINTHIMQ